MKIHLTLLPALVAASIPAAAQEAPVFLPIHNVASIEATCAGALASARDAVARLEAKPGGAGFFAEWNALQVQLEDSLNPISITQSTHPDKATRAATEPCLQKYNAFSTELYQDEKIYARIVDAKPANAREE